MRRVDGRGQWVTDHPEDLDSRVKIQRTPWVLSVRRWRPSARMVRTCQEARGALAHVGDSAIVLGRNAG